MAGAGVHESQLGGASPGGPSWGVAAPKAKDWSITSSPYLRLPFLYPGMNIGTELVGEQHRLRDFNNK